MTASNNRLRILLFLRQNGEASLHDLGQGLGLSRVTLRRHLDELTRSGVVSRPEKRRRPGPGRPPLLYSLTPRAETWLPENYRDLASALLRSLEAQHGTEWVRRHLHAAGVALAEQGLGVSANPGHPDFMPQVLAALEARGYLPAIGTWAGRRCLTFSHCPYLAASRHSPVVCAMDQALLETMLGEPVVLFRRIAERDPQCVFLLGV